MIILHALPRSTSTTRHLAALIRHHGATRDALHWSSRPGSRSNISHRTGPASPRPARKPKKPSSFVLDPQLARVFRESQVGFLSRLSRAVIVFWSPVSFLGLIVDVHNSPPWSSARCAAHAQKLFGPDQGHEEAVPPAHARLYTNSLTPWVPDGLLPPSQSSPCVPYDPPSCSQPSSLPLSCPSHAISSSLAAQKPVSQICSHERPMPRRASTSITGIRTISTSLWEGRTIQS